MPRSPLALSGRKMPIAAAITVATIAATTTFTTTTTTPATGDAGGFPRACPPFDSKSDITAQGANRCCSFRRTCNQTVAQILQAEPSVVIICAITDSLKASATKYTPYSPGKYFFRLLLEVRRYLPPEEYSFRRLRACPDLSPGRRIHSIPIGGGGRGGEVEGGDGPFSTCYAPPKFRLPFFAVCPSLKD